MPSTWITAKKFRPCWSRWLLPALFFCVLTMLIFWLARWQEDLQNLEQEAAASIESAANTAGLRERFKLHALFLRSLKAFAVANLLQADDLEAWQRFTNEIKVDSNLPGLFAFAYAPVIRRDQADALVARIRRESKNPDFTIYPPIDSDFVAPIIFIAPDGDIQQRALGFNLLSESTRRDVIEAAVINQDVALSGSVVLIIDKDTRRPGFLLAQAIFRPGQPINTVDERHQALAGIVMMGYRADEFIDALKSSFSNRFALQVFDDGNANRSTERLPVLIFDSDPALQNTADTPVIRRELDFGGRNWILKFRPLPHSDAGGTIDRPKLIIVAGTIGNLLLSLLIFYLTMHRAQSELIEHRDHLQELVAQRTARLDQALTDAQAATQAKSEFLTNMSHELRTPMHAILSFSELGKRRTEGASNEKIHQFFSRIAQSANRLLHLIDDLLDLSKLEAGRMTLNYRQTSLPLLIQGVHSQLESLIQQRDLSLEFINRAEDEEISVDPKRIEQVIHNLLSNAIKFSPVGGCIRISLSDEQLPHGRRIEDKGFLPAITIRIADNGPGIPPDELESVFGKFIQSSSTKTGAGGTGLGLAISQEIVSRHRGTISAANNISGGACFIVTLPKNCSQEFT